MRKSRTIKSKNWVRWAIVLGLIGIQCVVQIVPPFLLVATSLLLVALTYAAWRVGESLLLQLGIMISISTIPWIFPGLMWPGPVFLGMSLVWGIYWISKDRRFSFAWMRRGQLNRQTLRLGGIFVIVSSVALYSWNALLHPDLKDLKEMIPPVSWIYIGIGGILFSAANAFAEEFLFRGIMYNALHEVIARPISVILIQGVAFGFIHLHGFPRGWIGVILASIYGFMMGIVRQTSKGLLAPWVFHVFADITIVIILATCVT